jgi:anti-sigma regulatory factor (Ser/Thr protein kinase)
MTITADATEKAARAPMRDGKPTHHAINCVPEQAGRLPLIGRPAAAHAAREFVRELLGSSCASLNDVVTVVSELVTNAVLHSGSGEPGGLLTVEITACRHLVRVAVIDQGLGSLTDATEGTDDRIGGQGLFVVVSALAIGWGTYTCPGGRVVWAELPAHWDSGSAA